jgi:hypothetical protein
MNDIKAKIADYIARGAVQLSRKGRAIGVPPTLPEGKTYLDLLREQDPIQWEHKNLAAREDLIRRNYDLHVKLSDEEFSEWLVQHGCKPLARPLEPYETWAEYWDENDTHPTETRR